MRVVHVAPTAFGGDGIYGGGERYPLELARAIAAHADCTLLTFGRRAHTPPREPGGLQVDVLPARGHLRRHPAHPIGPGLPRALRGFDVVHAHQLWATPSRVAAATARVRGTPVAITDHGLLGSTPRPIGSGLVDRFLTVSKYSAEVLHVPPRKTTVIYGGVDTARYTPGEGGRARSGVLFVGRLTPHKGVDRLLRALPSGATLTVVGTAGHDARPPESGYPALLRRLAAADGRDVRFLGAVSDADLLELYRGARVLVLPSVEETCYGKPVRISELLGLTVLEAMACGAAVVASRLGGLREVVVEGETGYLVTPGDTGELAEALEAVLGDGRLAARLGRNGRHLAQTRFTWDACARRCVEAYRTMAVRTGGPGAPLRRGGCSPSP